ncbi:hypothetical protein BJF78_00355 [Pseudonocardia sp. CNS-139]|nr:hypothetical protein BJF78_00355 [Pseudonocardia sp. CNS-139]
MTTMTDVTVGHVLVELGQQAVDVLCAADGGLGAPVRRARIWDAADSELATGDLVLAVGVVAASPLLSRLLAAAAVARVAAVAIRGPVNLAWVRAEAEQVGVTVLVVRCELSWDHVHGRVRALVAGATEPPSGPSDLYVVASTAAAALGGAVEIDDARLRLLAFAHPPGGRMALVTPLPARSPAWLAGSDLLRRLRCAGEPVRVDPPGGRAHLVVPVRAGGDVLGYVWLTEGSEPLGRRHQRVLAGVARVVAGHLRRAGGAECRPLRELLARALARGDTAALAARLRLDRDTAFAVVGFRPRGRWPDPAVDPLYVRDQLELRAELAGGAAVVHGDHVYAVVPVGRTDPGDLTGLAAAVVSLIASQLGWDLVAVAEPVAASLDGLAGVREQLDRALHLLAEDPDRAVATAAELRPRVTLAMVRELARDRPEILAGPVQTLHEIDRTRRTDYLTTLRAYFDAASDLTEAARVLFVHRNTLRYRLRRIQELCGLDLSDPVERLVAELQLRLLPGDAPPARVSAVEQRASG